MSAQCLTVDAGAHTYTWPYDICIVHPYSQPLPTGFTAFAAIAPDVQSRDRKAVAAKYYQLLKAEAAAAAAAPAAVAPAAAAALVAATLDPPVDAADAAAAAPLLPGGPNVGDCAAHDMWL